MNPHDDETLLAYVDGELGPGARADFESAMAADQALARRVAEQRRLRAALQGAFDPVLDEPVPDSLAFAARGGVPAGRAATVVPIQRDRHGRTSRQSVRATWFAAAASLVLGVVLGQRLGERGADASLVVADGGALVAAGALADALTNRVAAHPENNGPRLGLSFLSKDGGYCRTFTVTGAEALQGGLACRTAEGRWQVRVLEAVDVEQSATGALRPASSVALPESVRRAVDASITGETLDAAAEEAARTAGWRPPSASR